MCAIVCRHVYFAPNRFCFAFVWFLERVCAVDARVATVMLVHGDVMADG